PVPALVPDFRWIGTGNILGVPVPVILLAIVFLGSWWILTRSRFGRYIYAVGGNPHAANTSGINISRVRFSVYVISGGLEGLAGMILSARTVSALPQAGISYE
ncbi:ABC transporter permease, partial [Brucella melitensis]|uniref:ABC transporter permease n=1 Tax=Brucella melitensis TaxID=29459 RepID=UPI003C6C8D64